MIFIWATKTVFRVYYWFLILWLSFKWCWKFNLGDEVIYQGKRWRLNQGVCDPSWNLVRGDQKTNSFEKADHVHRSKFRKVWTPRNILRSFCSGYRFYMGYWYGIWVNSGIKPWMRACNIWAKRRK
ncbi:hypothetical protein LCGC14_1347070 [marine sediment metagenome]|uniref:Uncharacterized protein n=1 Tax=marine sediment metagenome TaxID=412755 RepID=A0A0F9MSP7_9ZZZZ